MQKPAFVVVIRNGTLSCIYSLNGNQDVHYLLIDEDALEETEEEMEAEMDTDTIVRHRLNTDPDQFLLTVDGWIDSPADLYQPDTFR